MGSFWDTKAQMALGPTDIGVTTKRPVSASAALQSPQVQRFTVHEETGGVATMQNTFLPTLKENDNEVGDKLKSEDGLGTKRDVSRTSSTTSTSSSGSSRALVEHLQPLKKKNSKNTNNDMKLVATNTEKRKDTRGKSRSSGKKNRPRSIFSKGARDDSEDDVYSDNEKHGKNGNIRDGKLTETIIDMMDQIQRDRHSKDMQIQNLSSTLMATQMENEDLQSQLKVINSHCMEFADSVIGFKTEVKFYKNRIVNLVRSTVVYEESHKKLVNVLKGINEDRQNVYQKITDMQHESKLKSDKISELQEVSKTKELHYKDSENELTNQLEAIRKTLAESDVETTKLREEISDVNMKLLDNEKESESLINALRAKLGEVEENLTQKVSEVDKLIEQLSQAEQEKSTKEQDLIEQTAINEQLKSDIEKTKTEFTAEREAWNENKQRINSSMSKLQEWNESLNSTLEDIQDKYKMSIEENEKLKSSMDEFKADSNNEINNLKTQLKEAKDEHKSSKSISKKEHSDTIEKIKRDHDVLTQQLRNHNQTCLARRDAEIANLNVQIQMLSDDKRELQAINSQQTSIPSKDNLSGKRKGILKPTFNSVSKPETRKNSGIENESKRKKVAFDDDEDMQNKEKESVDVFDMSTKEPKKKSSGFEIPNNNFKKSSGNLLMRNRRLGSKAFHLNLSQSEEVDEGENVPEKQHASSPLSKNKPREGLIMGQNRIRLRSSSHNKSINGEEKDSSMKISRRSNRLSSTNIMKSNRKPTKFSEERGLSLKVNNKDESSKLLSSSEDTVASAIVDENIFM